LESYNNIYCRKKLHLIWFAAVTDGGGGRFDHPGAADVETPEPLTRSRVAGEVTGSALTHALIARPTMQMLNPHCGVDRDPRGVVRLTICNAGPLNILGSAVIDGVRRGLEVVAAERQIRVLVIAGQSEKSMIGGADIKEMAKLDQASAEKFITGLRDLCEAVRAFPAPVIARMPGWCLGGGLEVAASCDVRIAAHDAKIGMPEVKVGIPSVIHAALLPRLIGWGRARWLVMTAENIDAATALAWGLVDVVAPEGGLDAAVERTVKALLECGAEALRSQKALFRQWEELPLKESVDLSIGAFGRSFLTDEPRRLMQGFIDRKR
jgi:enoyl-CoA hydratase/carnithine racemase